METSIIVPVLGLVGGLFAYALSIAKKLGEEIKARELDQKEITSIRLENKDANSRLNQCEQLLAGFAGREEVRDGEMARWRESLENKFDKLDEKLDTVLGLLATKGINR